MNDTWLRRIAWALAFYTLTALTISAVILFLAPDHSSDNWLEAQVRAVVGLGAPILGLIIISKQPRQRIGWLWIIYGLLVSFRTLGLGIYFYGGSQPSGYSALEYFLIWFSETANLGGFVCLALLMLWFPDGQLPSRRWRILYIWLFLAVAVLFSYTFVAGTNWNGAESGGLVIENPYGFLPADVPTTPLPLAFFSLVIILILAAVSLVFRYRAAGQLIRLQLRWFILGGFLYLCLDFFPVFFIDESQIDRGPRLFLYILSFSAVIPLYFAIGIAILRYRLWDIDVIIRKTLVYAVLTGLLALVYFGLVILLQNLFESLTGEQSPIAIVLSTLVIAALFAPLRRRIQDFIDRRFFRKKYDAQQVLAQFANTARDETDMDQLTAELTRVIQEAMQPDRVDLWLKR